MNVDLSISNSRVWIYVNGSVVYTYNANTVKNVLETTTLTLTAGDTFYINGRAENSASAGSGASIYSYI